MKLRSLLFILLFLFSVQTSYAREPATNVGTSLSVMKSKFPELRFIGSDEKGDKYEDGYPENGIAMFFYFKDDILIEECMIVQSYDGFAYDVYNSWIQEIYLKCPGSQGRCGLYFKHVMYPHFRMHIIYESENGVYTALLIYEKGGSRDGMTYNDL